MMQSWFTSIKVHRQMTPILHQWDSNDAWNTWTFTLLSKGPCESTKSFRGGPMNVPIASRRVAQDKQTPTSVVGFIVLSSILQGNIMFSWSSGSYHDPGIKRSVCSGDPNKSWKRLAWCPLSIYSVCFGMVIWGLFDAHLIFCRGLANCLKPC